MVLGGGIQVEGVVLVAYLLICVSKPITHCIVAEICQIITVRRVVVEQERGQ